MPRPISLLLLSLLLALALPAANGGAAEPTTPAPALLVAGRGTELRLVDGEPMDATRMELAPGPHSIRFESTATVEPQPGLRSRVIREICEARFRARPGVVYVLVQEVIASRGARSWHHQLSSFVHDEDRDRATGECVCRTAPLE